MRNKHNKMQRMRQIREECEDKPVKLAKRIVDLEECRERAEGSPILDAVQSQLTTPNRRKAFWGGAAFQKQEGGYHDWINNLLDDSSFSRGELIVQTIGPEPDIDDEVWLRDYDEFTTAYLAGYLYQYLLGYLTEKEA